MKGMDHKGYYAKVKFDTEDRIFVGRAERGAGQLFRG